MERKLSTEQVILLSRNLVEVATQNILKLKLGMEMSIIGQGSELNEATKSTVRRSDR